MQTRTLILGGMTLVAALYATTLLSAARAQDQPTVLTVSGLRVVDDQGRERINLGWQDSKARVVLLSADGEPGCELTVDPDGSRLRILDENGAVAVEVFQRRAKGPPPSPRMPTVESLRGLISYDSDGSKQVVLANVGSSAHLGLYGDVGAPGQGAGADLMADRANVEFRLWSGGESNAVSLVVPDAQGNPSIRVSHRGAEQWSTPTGK